MRHLLSFAILAVFFAVPALADPPPRSGDAPSTVGDVIFKEAERVLIEDFFGKKAKAADDEAEEADDEDDDGKGKGKKHKDKGAKGKSKGLPPGLAKKKQLPPGLARQLERKGKLPPGLAKRDLPEDLEDRLPPPPEGTERVIVDKDVVLIEQATGTILDILTDVVTDAASGK